MVLGLGLRVLRGPAFKDVEGRHLQSAVGLHRVAAFMVSPITPSTTRRRFLKGIHYGARGGTHDGLGFRV